MPARNPNAKPRPRPLNMEELKARFPVGKPVVIDNPRATGPVNAKVAGVRYGGQPGTKGYSLFIDTVEERGEGLKPVERSVRPAYCTPA